VPAGGERRRADILVRSNSRIAREFSNYVAADKNVRAPWLWHRRRNWQNN